MSLGTNEYAGVVALAALMLPIESMATCDEESEIRNGLLSVEYRRGDSDPVDVSVTAPAEVDGRELSFMFLMAEGPDVPLFVVPIAANRLDDNYYIDFFYAAAFGGKLHVIVYYDNQENTYDSPICSSVKLE